MRTLHICVCVVQYEGPCVCAAICVSLCVCCNMRVPVCVSAVNTSVCEEGSVRGSVRGCERGVCGGMGEEGV